MIDWETELTDWLFEKCNLLRISQLRTRWWSTQVPCSCPRVASVTTRTRIRARHPTASQMRRLRISWTVSCLQESTRWTNNSYGFKVSARLLRLVRMSLNCKAVSTIDSKCDKPERRVFARFVKNCMLNASMS